MTAAELAALVDGQPTGPGRYRGFCPSHDDRHRSLDIATGADGRVLLCCRAGCSTEDVVAKLGLTLRDLFPASTLTPEQRSQIARDKSARTAVAAWRAQRERMVADIERIATKHANALLAGLVLMPSGPEAEQTVRTWHWMLAVSRSAERVWRELRGELPQRRKNESPPQRQAS